MISVKGVGHKQIMTTTRETNSLLNSLWNVALRVQRVQRVQRIIIIRDKKHNTHTNTHTHIQSWSFDFQNNRFDFHYHYSIILK